MVNCSSILPAHATKALLRCGADLGACHDGIDLAGLVFGLRSDAIRMGALTCCCGANCRCGHQETVWVTGGGEPL
jgi:hypothetical protein